MVVTCIGFGPNVQLTTLLEGRASMAESDARPPITSPKSAVYLTRVGERADGELDLTLQTCLPTSFAVGTIVAKGKIMTALAYRRPSF